MGYNVIWIDDEWDTRGGKFIQMCKLRHQILISAYKTRKEGIAALENNLKYWDAVILDAKAFNNSSTNEVADVDGLYEAIRQIERLELKRHVPYFVFTRQPDLMDDKMFEKSVGKFYKKDLEGQNDLIAALKEEVSKSARYQIKSIYHDMLEPLNDISRDAYEDIVDILEAIHYPELTFTPKLHFNPLRQALECIFRTANKVGVIPDDFFSSGNVNLNQCFMYLIGRDAEKIGMRYGEQGEKIVSGHIQNMMSLIINLGNVNSHSKLNDSEIQMAESKITKDGMSSKYLVFSMALQLCEIASWMNRYITKHPNKEENLKKCILLEVDDKNQKKDMLDERELVGLLEEHDGICHMGANFLVLLKHKEWLGKIIKVHNYVTNSNAKTKQYPYFIREQDFELLNELENGSK